MPGSRSQGRVTESTRGSLTLNEQPLRQRRRGCVFVSLVGCVVESGKSRLDVPCRVVRYDRDAFLDSTPRPSTPPSHPHHYSLLRISSRQRCQITPQVGIAHHSKTTTTPNAPKRLGVPFEINFSSTSTRVSVPLEHRRRIVATRHFLGDRQHFLVCSTHLHPCQSEQSCHLSAEFW